MNRRRLMSAVVVLCVLLCVPAAVAGQEQDQEWTARSALLIDARSGQILFSLNPDEPLPPASLTKIMTLALICEAVEGGRAAWDDRVVTSDLAASLGGSQIWLVQGETMTLKELALAIAIASANDAAAAAGEHLAGSHTSFVQMMNDKAEQLGMTTAAFRNPHGLDEEGHVLSARDVALMSKWAVQFPDLLAMTSRWEDFLRDGDTWLVNTNRLIKMVAGADGLKTGSTSGAKFCVSATAQRENTRLIAVIMGAPDSASRFDEARQLLNYGFANYRTLTLLTPGQIVSSIPVSKGKELFVDVVAANILAVTLGRGVELESSVALNIPELMTAPIEAGSVVGTAVIEVPELGEVSVDLVTRDDVPRAKYGQILARVIMAVLANFR